MKNITEIARAVMFTVAAFIIFSSSTLLAQNAETINSASENYVSTLYVVVQRSDAAENMQENFTRWNWDVVDYYADRPSLVFLNYDITDENTIEATKGDVEKYSLLYLLNANKQPGRVFLIDPNHQRVINMIDIRLTSEQLRNLIEEASPRYEKAETGF
ncbi:MAG: hypothetical protein KBG21_07545 [Ignavibacteria bacterium]|nr:hypothetical protein [Ignavibacteria bacterium]